jgi:mercuric ion transport protein
MNRTWKQNLVTVPAIGVSILPKLACPACWPAYAALLSSVGLGFLISATYLLPMTAVLLSLALAALAFRAKQRRGYRPFLLGFVASAAVLFSKFVWESKPTMYSAFGLLVVASLWNVWPRKNTNPTTTTCPNCKVKEVTN